MSNLPKALLCWSSAKDSAWTLHRLREAGQVNVVGLLTTINSVPVRSGEIVERDGFVFVDLIWTPISSSTRRQRVGNISTLRRRALPSWPPSPEHNTRTQTLTAQEQPDATVHISILFAPTAAARLTGILCRHTAAVNRHVARPDQHG